MPVMIPRALATFALLICLAVSVLVLGGCRDRDEWRQKLTVTVDTPAGERSGSSVVQVEALFGQLPASGNEVEYTVTGEATVVEVAPGRYLFALLRDVQELAAQTWRDQLPSSRKDWLPRINHMSGSRVVDPKNYPTLVTFRDPSDPTIVEVVNPSDLASTFGPGFRLDNLTLEITDEQSAAGKIEAALSWWNNLQTPIGGNVERRYGDPLDHIRKGDFVR
jgi:hypothetical protein